ncbi:hypothetical protein ACLMJK_006555 [Lecanora helva]
MSDRLRLEYLPLELLHAIFRNLHPQDVKAIRAANKLMKVTASPYLFTRVYIAFRSQTCDVFEKIVCHPIFGQTVTDIVLDTSIFTISQDRVIFSRSTEGVVASTQQSRKYSVEYLRLLREQENLRTNKRIEHLLTLASSKLRRLETFIYSDWRFICEKSGSNWYLEKGPMSWDFDVRNVCIPVSALPGMNLLPFQIYFHTIFNSFTSFPIRHFIQEPSVCGGSGVMYPNRPLCQLIADYRQFENPTIVSTNILTFSAAITGSPRNLEHDPPLLRSALLNLLGGFSNLRDLELSMDVEDLFPTDGAQIFLFRDCYWPCLQRLNLRGDFQAWAATPGSLISFLARHANTLRNLGVEGCQLVNTKETWVSVVDHIRRDLPLLKSLQLSKLEDGDFVLPRASSTCTYFPGGGRTIKKDIDTKFRRRQLDFLERWAVLKEPYGAESADYRARFAKVRSEWHHIASSSDH